MDTDPILLIIDPAVQCPCLEAINCIAKIVGEMNCNSEFQFSHVEYISPFLNNMRLKEFIQHKNIAAVICLGSVANITDELDCVKNLICDLEDHIFRKQIPFLGICFSHQMLAAMHGFKVDFLKQKESVPFRKHHHFRSFQILHPKLSILATKLHAKDYFSDNKIDLSFKDAVNITKNWKKKQWDLLSSQRDWVLTASENRVKLHIHKYSLKRITGHARHEQEVWHEYNIFGNEVVIAATSEVCTYEALVHNQNPFFSLQTHPETHHQDGYLLIKNFIYMSSLLYDVSKVR